MLGFGLSAKDSMSVTYIFLMGGSFSSMISNFKKKMPKENKFLMDYDLIIITLPMAASGALFGVPNWNNLDNIQPLYLWIHCDHFVHNFAELFELWHLPKIEKILRVSKINNNSSIDLKTRESGAIINWDERYERDSQEQLS